LRTAGGDFARRDGATGLDRTDARLARDVLLRGSGTDLRDPGKGVRTMKKAIASGRLSLSRETLTALSPADLEEINGGTWAQIGRTLVQLSKWACTTVTTIQSQRIITCK
jgi:hypothetical protein